MRTTAHPVSRPRAVLFAAASAVVVVGAVAVACSVAPPERPTAPAAERAAVPSAAPTKVGPSAQFFEFQVERQAAVRSGAGPHYPDALRAAHVRGDVIAQFVVDTAGRVDMSTLKVLKSDRPEFTTAVAEVLPQWRFTPAEVGGHHVKQLVQLPFQFAP